MKRLLRACRGLADLPVITGGRISLASLALAAWLGGAATGATISVVPERIKINDVHDGRQLVVTLDGVDITRQARYESSAPGVSKVDEGGFVSPVSAGSGSVRVVHAGAAAEVPVEVVAVDRARPVDFQNEVMPLLTRNGCNSGGCHGKASGQNGFRLSLFGFDPARDYQAIVDEARGRRVSPGAR